MLESFLGEDVFREGLRRYMAAHKFMVEVAAPLPSHDSPIADVNNLQQFGVRNIEMILGRDFLRAHRVLISTSQERFYYTYLGGQVFST